MAEERLIDEDKDRKYRLKVNEDGEQELVKDEGEEENTEAEPAEEVAFVTPEDYVQGDENALLEEERAKKREQEQKEREERQAKARELIANAEADCKAEKYSTALEFLAQAEEQDGENGDIYALRMRIYTRDFTDYTQIKEAAESADGVKKYSSGEAKEAIYKKAGAAIDSNIAQLRGKVKTLNEQNESKKAERAVKFKADRNKALIIFACVFALFVASAALCGYFSTIIYTVSTGLYLILTIVFAAVAFIALVACAFAARYLNIACRRVRMNNKNTSTSLGRELLEKQATLKAFLDVRDSLKAE